MNQKDLDRTFMKPAGMPTFDNDQERQRFAGFLASLLDQPEPEIDWAKHEETRQHCQDHERE